MSAALAFVVLMTFASATADGQKDVQWKTVQCSDMRCVSTIEEAARSSPTLTRFQVWEQGSARRNTVSGAPVFPPIIDWQPL